MCDLLEKTTQYIVMILGNNLKNKYFAIISQKKIKEIRLSKWLIWSIISIVSGGKWWKMPRKPKKVIESDTDWR